MARRAKSPRGGHLARPLRGLLAALLSIVVVLGIVRSGAAYIYCATMDEVVGKACCDLHVHGRSDGLPEVTSGSDCCSVKTLGTVPRGSVAARPAAIPAAPAITVPYPVADVSPRSRLLRRDSIAYEAPNTGPPKPSDIARRLRVFLI